VTLVDDALDARGLPRAFDFEGTPKQRVALVEEGVIRGTVWDRGTAALAGRESTGHALPLAARAEGAFASAVVMSPGEAESTEELAELVGNGIYVTRLHYLGVVNPREGVLTGMTKDGTFRIRNGKVAEPLVNLRFTVALPDLLADVPGLTRETLLVSQSDFYDARWAYGYRVPAIATACFNVTGSGSGPGL
jgi:predicted Zn-dependent protease